MKRLSTGYRQVRLWCCVGAMALLLACASSGYPPAAQCPQPRFTGKAPASVYNLTSPLTVNERDIAQGRRLYEGAADPGCHICHGVEGDGRGPMAEQFEPPPRNFACASTVNGIPDGQLYWIIKHGSPGTAMPEFDHLRERELWQLVMYVRELAR